MYGRTSFVLALVAGVLAVATLPPLARADGNGGDVGGAAAMTTGPLVCQEQRAQPFLVRGNWFPKTGNPDDVKRGREWFQQSIRYRTEHYGYFHGFGRPEWNAHTPREYGVQTTFMHLPITVHQRIVPALKCVEQALMSGPAHIAYHPHGIGGIRFSNTYRGGEVSNHVYGTAIDIDSDQNTCCGCVPPWNHHPLCAKRVDTIFERMVMPASWVETFERYGFYWLGHDVLEDTMHFEFLGDPDKILGVRQDGRPKKDLD